jgi:hypothetical protein
MPLIALWKSDPSTVAQFTIEQVVSFAGNGKLVDSSVCSDELREYLSNADTTTLAKYAEHCLTEKFDKSGQVLQDIVNEFGRRLDYKVTNGLYAGKKNAVGNDGLWLAPEGHSVVVEVKTTDAYRIPLDVIAKYRADLAMSETIGASSSILIVVGREDTGELEAQVRGSRHAWDIRLISVEALVKLVKIKENSEETETGRKIREVLIPIEYTRVDGLVDVVFAAAIDAQDQISEPSGSETTAPTITNADRTYSSDASAIQLVRESIVAAINRKNGISLIKKSRAMYWTADHGFRIACAVSKRYQSGNDYWYAFHPSWLEFLEGNEAGFFVLGCVDLQRAFALPISDLKVVLPKFNKTERSDGGMYWHVKLDVGTAGEVMLNVPKSDPISVEKYSIGFGSINI